MYNSNDAPRSRSVGMRSLAGIGVAALGAALLFATPAAADEPQEVLSSYASGQFLSGTLLSGDLAGLVALAKAEARNDGTQDKQTSKDPLHATVLQAVDVDVPGGVQLNAGPGVDAGVLNQYAEAERDGVSFGSSGAIGSDGAIGVGAVGAGGAGDLTIDLRALLGAEFAETITDLKLQLVAVAASASGTKDTAIGDYTLDGAVLSFSSPAIAKLTEKVDAALAGVDKALIDLESSNGLLGLALLEALDPVLSLIGSSASISIDIEADVRAALAELLRGAYGDSGVSFDLQTGQVHLDLAALHGDLNNLPVNTELLSAGVINLVLGNITETVGTLADQIVAKVTATLNQARISVRADVNLLTGPADCAAGGVGGVGGVVDDVVGGVGGVVDDIIGGVGGVVDGITGGTGGVGGIVDDVTGGTGVGDVIDDVTGGTGGVGGVVDDIVGGLLGGGGGGGLLGGNGIFGGNVMRAPSVTGVGGVLCTLTGELLSDLATTVDVDIVGTIGQILAGKAAQATATVSILGGTVPASINVNELLGDLRAALFDGLLDDDGAIAELVAALQLGLVQPATEGLLGSHSVGVALTDLLSVRVNLQELRQASTQGMAAASGSMFTQTAVRVSVLGGSAATLSVAAATVGPNITRVIDPGCTVNCGPGDEDPDPNPDPDPSCTGNCGPETTATDRLAYTGMGLATLIAVLLALLAAGAILAREGYRRTHPTSVD